MASRFGSRLSTKSGRLLIFGEIALRGEPKNLLAKLKTIVSDRIDRTDLQEQEKTLLDELSNLISLEENDAKNAFTDYKKAIYTQKANALRMVRDALKVQLNSRPRANADQKDIKIDVEKTVVNQVSFSIQTIANAIAGNPKSLFAWFPRGQAGENCRTTRLLNKAQALARAFAEHEGLKNAPK